MDCVFFRVTKEKNLKEQIQRNIKSTGDTLLSSDQKHFANIQRK